MKKAICGSPSPGRTASHISHEMQFCFSTKTRQRRRLLLVCPARENFPHIINEISKLPLFHVERSSEWMGMDKDETKMKHSFSGALQ
jgi:hypothetical protein